MAFSDKAFVVQDLMNLAKYSARAINYVAFEGISEQEKQL
jgi:hypothetical protein